MRWFSFSVSDFASISTGRCWDVNKRRVADQRQRIGAPDTRLLKRRSHVCPADHVADKRDTVNNNNIILYIIILSYTRFPCTFPRPIVLLSLYTFIYTYIHNTLCYFAYCVPPV